MQLILRTDHRSHFVSLLFPDLFSLIRLIFCKMIVLVCSGCHNQMPKQDRLGGLNNKYLFSHGYEGKKFQLKLSAHLVPGEGPSAWLPSHCILTWPPRLCAHREGETEHVYVLSCLFLYRHYSCWIRAPLF